MILPFIQLQEAQQELSDGLFAYKTLKARAYYRADQILSIRDTFSNSQPLDGMAEVELMDGTCFLVEGNANELAAMWQHATRYMTLTYSPKPAN